MILKQLGKEGIIPGLQGENALMAGDRIVSIDGERVLLYEDISIF